MLGGRAEGSGHQAVRLEKRVLQALLIVSPFGSGGEPLMVYKAQSHMSHK